MQSEPVAYVNGEFLPLGEARIPILDQGFLLGDGVFDVVSAWKGVIFRLDDHLDRFFDSLQAAHLGTPMTRDEWKSVLIETVRRNDLRDASIRFIVTRGVPQEVVADPRHFKPTVVVWVAPYIFLADEARRREGVRLMISSTRGFSPDTLDPRFKCLDRLHSQLVRLEATVAGYDDALWLDQHGHVAEGAASNVFLVKRGVLYTPRAGILRGITRQTFVELALAAGIEVREAELTAFDLYVADEVFTTSTAGGALPVREVMGRQIRGPVPGPVTQRLDTDYWTKRESGWHGTPVY